MGAARPTDDGNGTDGRHGHPAAHSAGGRARGRAAGEFFKPRGPRKVDPAALARRHGRLGKVPRNGRSELGKHFGIVVRAEMERQGYSQRELAKVAGISESEMSLLLNAKHKVWMDTAERVADALGFELEVLLARARALMEAAQLRGAQIGAARAAVPAALKTSIL